MRRHKSIIIFSLLTFSLTLSGLDASRANAGQEMREYADNIEIQKKSVELSDFDLEFIQKVLAQEDLKFRKNDYTIKKIFLLTDIKEKGNTDSKLEVFVYEISPEKDKHGLLPLFEKLTEDKYLEIMPITKAPHSCYLFANNGKLYIWGYSGMYSHYEAFEEAFFISYIKNGLFQ
jgi:hypothetical protein